MNKKISTTSEYIKRKGAEGEVEDVGKIGRISARLEEGHGRSWKVMEGLAKGMFARLWQGTKMAGKVKRRLVKSW